MSNLPARDTGYIDAEWREVPDEESAYLTVIACPHCGNDAATVFGTCYFCMKPLREQSKTFFARLIERLLS